MAKNIFVKRNIKKDLNDVLDFCREKGMDDDIELFSIVLDFYDVT